MHFPPLRYDCIQCGKSCGHWRVLVEEEARQRLEKTELAEQARKQGYQPFVACNDGLHRLGFRPEDDKCVFLRSDMLCAVHAELGAAAKPRACRQFPFFLVETPDGPFAGLSFRCTAVKQQVGRPMEVHRPQLEELRATGQYPRVGEGPIPLTPGHFLDWAGYLSLESFARESLSDPWRMLAVPARAASQAPWEATLREEWTTLPTPEQNELLQAFETTLMAGLMGALEGRDLAEMQAGTAILQAGQAWQPPRAQRPVSLAQLPLARAPDQRYLEHLLFRKYLLLGSSVLSRLAALYLAEKVLRFYSLAMDDQDLALDIVEGEMLSHAESLEPYFAAAEDGLLRHL
ncbi:MAG: hypothetical protein AMXMBFR33_08770 [Candidatus Xenobia bacterium]